MRGSGRAGASEAAIAFAACHSANRSRNGVSSAFSVSAAAAAQSDGCDATRAASARASGGIGGGDGDGRAMVYATASAAKTSAAMRVLVTQHRLPRREGDRRREARLVQRAAAPSHL